MIFRKLKHDDPPFYNALSDLRLSNRTRGILAYCLMQDKRWMPEFYRLREDLGVGDRILSEAFKELSRYDYAKLQRRHKDGHYLYSRWIIFEDPRDSKRDLEKLRREHGFADSSNSEDSAISAQNVPPEKNQKSSENNSKNGFENDYFDKGTKRADSFYKEKYNTGYISPLIQKSEFSPFIRKAVQVLEEHVLKTINLRRRRFSREKWYYDMNQLLKDLGNDKARLKEVLVQFTQSKKSKYIPLVESAHMFRDKFFRIERAMKKEEDEPSAPSQHLDSAEYLHKRITGQLDRPIKNQEYRKFIERLGE